MALKEANFLITNIKQKHLSHRSWTHGVERVHYLTGFFSQAHSDSNSSRFPNWGALYSTDVFTLHPVSDSYLHPL